MDLISLKDMNVELNKVVMFNFMPADCSYDWLLRLLNKAVFRAREDDLYKFAPNYFLYNSEDSDSLYYPISLGSFVLGYIKLNRTMTGIITMNSMDLWDLFRETDDTELRLSYILEEEFSSEDDEPCNMLDIEIFKAILGNEYDCIFIPSNEVIEKLDVKLKLLSGSDIDDSYYCNDYGVIFGIEDRICKLSFNSGEVIDTALSVERIKDVVPLYKFDFVDSYSKVRHSLLLVIPDLPNKYARIIFSNKNMCGVFNNENVSVELLSKCTSLIRNSNGFWND